MCTVSVLWTLPKLSQCVTVVDVMHIWAEKEWTFGLVYVLHNARMLTTIL